nr:carbohydrate ABC transporter permease [Lachnospiraceae bacterium]
MRIIRERGKIFTRLLIAVIFAVFFVIPTVLTICNSFMTETEITANYGKVFDTGKTGSHKFISESVNLKFIPDKVSFSQYATVLLKSPKYLLKFWNSVLYVVPIVIVQLLIASLAAYGFTRFRG